MTETMAEKMAGTPRILSRSTTRVSPWLEIVARDVQFAAGAPSETYHAVQQADYVAMLARVPDGRFLLVRQYRPAVEAFTWELPAGMVDPGEDPQRTAERELLEETGFPALRTQALGCHAPCTARLSNRIHSYFIETGERRPDAPSEPGLTVKLVDAAELGAMIRSGAFTLQLHAGTVLLAALRGLIGFDALMPPGAQPPD